MIIMFSYIIIPNIVIDRELSSDVLAVLSKFPKIASKKKKKKRFLTVYRASRSYIIIIFVCSVVEFCNSA